MTMTDARLILAECRAFRKGAAYRTACGDSVGDYAYTDCVHDAAKDLHRALDGRVPFFTLRAMLWRAAYVGARSAKRSV